MTRNDALKELAWLGNEEDLCRARIKNIKDRQIHLQYLLDPKDGTKPLED